MKNFKRFSLTAILALLIAALGPSVALAQRGGVRMSRPMLVRSHPVSRNGGSLRAAPSYSNSYSFGSGEGLFPGIGLGLGYGFYGSGESLGIQAAINPATQLQLAAAQRFLRDNRSILGYGGYYLLDGGGAYPVPVDEPAPESNPQQPQPQVIVLQQAPTQQAGVEPNPESQTAAPIPDEGEFTLVLRDGKTIQVVAFTHMKNNIVYIGPDGSRHTIAADEIDSDATVRVNQERGTPLQLPL